LEPGNLVQELAGRVEPGSDREIILQLSSLAGGHTYLLTAWAFVKARAEAVFTSLEIYIEDSDGSVLAGASDHTHAEPSVRLAVSTTRIIRPNPHCSLRVTCRVVTSFRDGSSQTRGLHDGGGVLLQAYRLGIC
jgi:hypothetical protein